MHWIWLSSLVVIFDQITKYLAEDMLIRHRPVNIFEGLNMTLVYNRGAAFSFLSNAGGWQRWFFMILSLGISIALIVWLRQLSRSEEGKRIFLVTGLALILGGAIGNLIDRALYGHVIDFIDVYYKTYHYPAFNIADSAISLGAAFLIIDMFKHRDTNE
jgi:signal peptidase II